jgi:Tfp pilus assembly protein PilV
MRPELNIRAAERTTFRLWRTRPDRRRGVTLAEVVVSSAVLVLAVVPVLRALTIAHVTGTAIERKTQSLILAQSKLDEIRARSICRYDGSFREDSLALADAYLCNVSDDEDPRLRLVTVTVGFDADADERLSTEEAAVTLTTYVARRR